MNVCLVWIYACVFSPLIVFLPTGNFAVEDNVADSLISSGK